MRGSRSHPGSREVRRVGQTRRRDSAERAIVDALRAVGAEVLLISGKGAPDLLIRFRGNVVGLEVKTGKGQRTEAQSVTQWPVVRSVEDGLRAIGAIQ